VTARHSETQRTTIYNLAAQSTSLSRLRNPSTRAEFRRLERCRVLEAIRILGMEKADPLLQASTSELFGLVQEIPKRDDTFYPRCAYAVAQTLCALGSRVNYREAYKCRLQGILFNQRPPAGVSC